MSVTWQGPLNLPAGHLGIVGTEEGIRIVVRFDEHGRIAFESDGDEIAVPPDLARALAIIVIAATGDADADDRDFAASVSGLARTVPS